MNNRFPFPIHTAGLAAAFGQEMAQASTPAPLPLVLWNVGHFYAVFIGWGKRTKTSGRAWGLLVRMVGGYANTQCAAAYLYMVITLEIYKTKFLIYDNTISNVFLSLLFLRISDD